MTDTLIGQALDIGKRMLQSGGEVTRVEDTIARILKAYGFTRVDVFTITSEIQVTAVNEKGEVFTQFRRIYKWGTDLTELERLNQISRDICAEKPSVSEIENMVAAKTSESSPKESVTDAILMYIGSIMAAGSFTLFFGGGVADALSASILACIIVFFNRKIHSKSENRLLIYFFLSFVTGIIGNLLVRLGANMGLAMDLDKVLIGCVMLTIPGISITYSVRDMLLGETITGLLRFAESILTTASIAGGYILSTIILGGGIL